MTSLTTTTHLIVHTRVRLYVDPVVAGKLSLHLSCTGIPTLPTILPRICYHKWSRTVSNTHAVGVAMHNTTTFALEYFCSLKCEQFDGFRWYNL